MYEFKINKKETLLDGRTIVWVSNKVGKTKAYITDVLNGKRTCSKLTAYCIIKACNEEKEIKGYFNIKKRG